MLRAFSWPWCTLLKRERDGIDVRDGTSESRFDFWLIKTAEQKLGFFWNRFDDHFTNKLVLYFGKQTHTRQICDELVELPLSQFSERTGKAQKFAFVLKNSFGTLFIIISKVWTFSQIGTGKLASDAVAPDLSLNLNLALTFKNSHRDNTKVSRDKWYSDNYFGLFDRLTSKPVSTTCSKSLISRTNLIAVLDGWGYVLSQK